MNELSLSNLIASLLSGNQYITKRITKPRPIGGKLPEFKHFLRAGFPVIEHPRFLAESVGHLASGEQNMSMDVAFIPLAG
jgi:hypothetical protein